MSWLTLTSFGVFDAVQGLFQLVENVSPQSNWELYGNQHSLLSKEMQKKLKRIEEIKNDICDLAHIPSSNINIRLQNRGIVENHGNSSNAVLGVSLQLLTAYKMTSNKQSNLVTCVPAQTFQAFIEQLPNHPEEIRKTIESLSNEKKEDYAKLAKTFHLNVDDDEMRFIIGHEILGHALHNDALSHSLYSTFFNTGAFCTALIADAYCSFSGSTFFWQSVFHGVSYIGLQSVLLTKEKKADIQSLKHKEHIDGGIKFFKRMFVVNLLNEELMHSHSLDIVTTIVKKGSHLFSLSHEESQDRLMRCLSFKQAIENQ